MNIDFWLPGVNAYDLEDHRAVAACELDEAAGSFPDEPVHLQTAHDWLSPGVPPEWIADMLHVISRTSGVHFFLRSCHLARWQQCLSVVAALPLPGAAIARDWLDGIPPRGLHLLGSPDQAALLAAIPHQPPPYQPGILADTPTH